MNKQIEEYIAFVEMQNELCDKPCDICKMYGKGCIPTRMAKKLAKKGYRKTEDVAREIITEILFYADTHKDFCGFGEFLAELEEKYFEREETK